MRKTLLGVKIGQPKKVSAPRSTAVIFPPSRAIRVSVCRHRRRAHRGTRGLPLPRLLLQPLCRAENNPVGHRKIVQNKYLQIASQRTW